MNTPRSLLFDGAHVRVVAQDAGTPDVVVTFNELGTVTNGLAFWGNDLLARCGVAAFGVVTPQANWYPREEMAAAARAIAEACRGRRIVAYGHSQGGYGALKYAAAIGARLSVAFCPQWSIAPDSVGAFDGRFTRFHRPELANGEPVCADDLGPASVIVHDPREPVDRVHADHLMRLPGMERVICPFSSHETIRLVTEAGLADDLVALLRRGAPIAALRGLLRSGRRRSMTYLRHRFAALLARGRLDLCANLVPFLDEAADIHLDLARRLAAGERQSAEALLLDCEEALLSQMPLVDLWITCRRHGLRHGELRVALLLRGSTEIFERLYLVNTLIALDLPDRARSEFALVSLLPEASSQRALMAPFVARLGLAPPET